MLDPARRTLLRAAATALVGWATLPGSKPVEAKPHNRVPTVLANHKTWPVARPALAISPASTIFAPPAICA